MRTKDIKISKKQWCLLVSLVIIAIFVPLVAYAITITVHAGNDNNCTLSPCVSLPDGVKDDSTPGDKTIGVVHFDYNNNDKECTVAVPNGCEITHIIVKAGNKHRIYVLDPGTTSFSVDTYGDDFKNNGGQTPDISHVRVIYTGTPTDPKIDITGTKVWVADPDTEYPDITLNLYRDNVLIDTHVFDADDYTGDTWGYTFAGLPKDDGEGHTYVYTIDEASVPAGYDKSISDDGLTITNTQQERETIDIPITKVWVADPDTEYPDITLNLYRDNVLIDTHVFDADDYTGDTWGYTFTGLPKDDGEGHTYVYTIDEASVPAGYDKSISDDGLTITNTQQKRETIDIPVTKVWRGKDPNSNTIVDVFLVKDGHTTDYYVSLSAGNNWSCTFEDLEPGHIYGVEEDSNDIPNRYTSSVTGNAESGFVVTNKYNPPHHDEDDEDEIPEPEVPLDELPGPDVPLDELPDTNVPLDEVPTTGDERNYALLMYFLTVSLVAFGTLRYIAKRSN